VFIQGFAISAGGAIVEERGFVFETIRRGGEDILAVKSADETVHGSFAGKIGNDFMVPSLQVKAQIRSLTAFLLNV
jgi:hypothetical protein